MASESETAPEPHDLAEARQIIATLRQQQSDLEAERAQLEERLGHVEREKLRLQQPGEAVELGSLPWQAGVCHFV